MPRTGSTFLTSALAEITGFKRLRLNHSLGRSEQELYLPKLLDGSRFGSVTQQHFRATQANLQLLRDFDIRPIVLVRNIFDVTISIRDYMLAEKCSTWPTFYCDEEFWDLPEARQYDAIIDLGLPWYFSFFVSWSEAQRKGEVPMLWVTYEDARQDWVAASKRILDFCEIDKPIAEIEAALSRNVSRNAAALRFNKGITGRGAATLSEEQRRRIAGLAAYYPHIDFSMIGIPARDQPAPTGRAAVL